MCERRKRKRAKQILPPKNCKKRASRALSVAFIPVLHDFVSSFVVPLSLLLRFSPPLSCSSVCVRARVHTSRRESCDDWRKSIQFRRISNSIIWTWRVGEVQAGECKCDKWSSRWYIIRRNKEYRDFRLRRMTDSAVINRFVDGTNWLGFIRLTNLTNDRFTRSQLTPRTTVGLERGE